MSGLEDLPFGEWYCKGCETLKSKYDFYYNPKMQKVLGNLCKKCLSKRNGERIKKLNYNRVSDDTLVRCCHCKEIKEAVHFYSNRRKKNGLLSRCEICEKKRLMQTIHTRIEDHRLVRCTNCNEVKRASEFNSNTYKRNGLFSWCRDCYRIQRRKYL